MALITAVSELKNKQAINNYAPSMWVLCSSGFCKTPQIFWAQHGIFLLKNSSTQYPCTRNQINAKYNRSEKHLSLLK